MSFLLLELVDAVPVLQTRWTCRSKSPESSQKEISLRRAFLSIAGFVCDWNDADRGRLGVRTGGNRWVSIRMT